MGKSKRVSKIASAGALACLMALGSAASALAETAVQGSQTTSDSTSESGSSTGTNQNSLSGGSRAFGVGDASAQQNGSNASSSKASGRAASGDVVAGSQVAGAVDDDVTVQNQNSSTGASAVSGDASIVNAEEFGLGAFGPGLIFGDSTGPLAFSVGGTASASQIGDNASSVEQVAEAATGDAVGGAQVTGIVGGGSHRVQVQNDASSPGEISSGDATTVNAEGISIGLAPFDGAGPVAFSVEGNAQASQVGDNSDATLQDASVATGDALFGSQVTGVVGGSAQVQGQNTADDGVAASGNAAALNFGAAFAGPAAQSIALDAQTAQTGDNSSSVDQVIAASTGDALSGSQVVGAVGDPGASLDVQNQQTTSGVFAASGDISGSSQGQALAGPVSFAIAGDSSAEQIGDNAAAVAQDFGATTGDSVTASQVTGAVGHNDVTIQNQNTADGLIPQILAGSATSGDIGTSVPTGVILGGFNAAGSQAGPVAFSIVGDVDAAQIGDNATGMSQNASATTGDAVAGGQITGVVTDGPGASVDVQNQNNALSTAALSGSVIGAGALNSAGNALLLGPISGAGPTGFSVVGDAGVTQNGDNEAVISQDATASTGDAVGGAQVTGVVSDDRADVTVQNQNTAESAGGFAGSILLGAPNVSGGSAGPVAVAIGADVPASVSQLGDNAVAIDQTADLSTGDGVAGSQVTGLVAGDDAALTVQNQNDSLDAQSTSGNVQLLAGNATASHAGPALLGFGDLQASQVGDNAVGVDQAITVATGDGVAGSQVTGLVAGDGAETTIQNQNASDGDEARSGSVIVTDDLNDAIVGAGPQPIFTGGLVPPAPSSSAAQIGDDAVSVDQTADVSTGDAVAGSQVSGVVTGDDSDNTAQVSNDALDPIATSGSATDLSNSATGQLGPVAEALLGDAHATHNGDTSADSSQDLGIDTGDAVAGAQIGGVVS